MSDYWSERELANILANKATAETIRKQIEARYNVSYSNLEKLTNDFYMKYANDEGISLADAKQKVANFDVEAFANKAAEYVANRDFSNKANEELKLYNLTMKVNRLELLKSEVGLELADLYNDLEKIGDLALSDAVRDELLRQSGILGTTLPDIEKAITNIVGGSFKNATFSDRLWANQGILKHQIDTLLTRGLIQGQHPQELARNIKHLILTDPRTKKETAQYIAERLMITEYARMQGEAQKLAYIEAGYDKYKYIAEPTACAKCLALDNKVFDVDDMSPGINMYPMHPWCMCGTTAQYSDDQISKLTDDELRAINSYISSDAYKLNDLLRNGEELSEDMQKVFNDLNSALDKLPIFEGKVVRELNFNYNESGLNAFLDKFMVNEEIEFSEFLSSSVDGGYHANPDVILYLMSKNARDIRMFNEAEQEILFKSDSVFKILYKQKTDKVNRIYLEEL